MSIYDEIYDESMVNSYNNARCEIRNLVALLASIFPSVMSYHSPDESGEDHDWGWVVYLKLPSGQVSFHIGEDRTTWFKNVQVANITPWDGHNRFDKWERISQYIEEASNGEETG